jgi:hypothetical protein
VISRDLALRAIAILEREATALFEAEVFNGNWSHAAPEVKADYDEMVAVALELRREAGA